MRKNSKFQNLRPIPTFPYIFSSVGNLVKSKWQVGFAPDIPRNFFPVSCNLIGYLCQILDSRNQRFELREFSPIFPISQSSSIIRLGHFQSHCVFVRTEGPAGLIFGKKMGFKCVHGIVEKNFQISKISTFPYIFSNVGNLVKSKWQVEFALDNPRNFFAVSWHLIGHLCQILDSRNQRFELPDLFPIFPISQSSSIIRLGHFQSH